VRTQGRARKVKGIMQGQRPVKALDAGDPGRLINAVDALHWCEIRGVALFNAMARGGLRVSEGLALKINNVKFGHVRSRMLLVGERKGPR
jgi:site-specific recombinase XerD